MSYLSTETADFTIRKSVNILGFPKKLDDTFDGIGVTEIGLDLAYIRHRSRKM